jgi:hypothetical protein
MVHHSIAVVITSFLTNFVERSKGELRRTPLLGTSVNKGKEKGRVRRTDLQVRGSASCWEVGAF